jgi:hypothetical protein
VRSHDIALASVEVQDFNAEARSVNDAVDQSLETNLVDFGLHRVYPRGTVRVQRYVKESLIAI